MNSQSESTPLQSSFFYVSCQHGAEPILKSNLCEPSGPFRLAYSARGLLTFKSGIQTPVWSRALPDNPLIRARGHVLKRMEGEQSDPMIREFLAEFGDSGWTAIHVWQRDIARPGWNGFEPGQSVLADAVAQSIEEQLRQSNDPRAESINRVAPVGAQLLEIIIDEPNRWWIAAKPVVDTADQWPGGVPPIHVPDEIISRAYLKIAEAVAWSGISISPGEAVVEIGASPGGACQCLIDLGAKVTGIDPAEMDERIASHPQFTHWRSRSLQVKRRLFKGFRILVCDANVAPNYTLDTVESIITYPTSRFRALILTMKLSDWEKASEIPGHLERVRSWGFQNVKARQLAFNRREYCLCAQ